MRLTWSAIAALFPVGAAAGCFGSGEPMFHCEIEGSGKALDVCLQDGVAIYRFGPPAGAPEMLLARRVEDVDYQPWNGIGRWLSEAMRFDNAGTSYEIAFASDRLAPNDPPHGSVVVFQEGQAIARLDCRPGSVDFAGFIGMFDAKEAAGQTWCHETREWKEACAE